MKRLCCILLCFIANAAPLTLANPSKDYGVKGKTTLSLSQSTKTLKAGTLANNDSLHGGTQTQVTLGHSFVYTPRSDLEFMLAADGSYRENEKISFVRYNQEGSIALNSFWLGASYVSPFFDDFSPTFSARTGSLQNATSYFVALTLKLQLTERAALATTWERHFYQLKPQEFGWRSSSEHYAISTISAEYSYTINPNLDFSFAVIRRGSGGERMAENRYLLSIRRLF
ncbi:MAG: hypothetical protein K2O85_09495 [Helicobacter sp.]|nr:hypothetical protein [Helicobacter sp.]